MEKEFRYYLVDAQGRSYFVDNDGNVSISSIPRDLISTPDGWMDTTISYGRSTKFPGVIRTFTVPLRFIKDGAVILKYLYYTYGIQAVGNLVILKRDIVDGTDVYKQYYVGGINFAQFNDQSNVVECEVLETGLSELVKANEGTKYDIPIEAPAAIPVLMDGITMYSNVKILNYANIIYDPAFPDGQPDTITSTFVYISSSVTDTETKYPSAIWGTTVPYYGTEAVETVPTENWLTQTDRLTNFHLTGTMKFKIAGSSGYRLKGFIKSGTQYDTGRIIDLSPQFTSTGFPMDVSFDVDVNFTMGSNERLYPFVQNDGGDGKVIIFGVDNNLTIVYDYNREATTVMCLRPLYVLQQLINKITNGKYTATSTLLEGEGYFYPLTSGEALRGFVKGVPVDYIGPVIKTSLNDFIQSYNVKFNIGLGTRDKVIVEKKEYFFNSNDLTDLGEVADFILSPATDHLFNTLKIGWPEQNYDDVNGLNEFNTTQNYTTPVTKVVKALDLTSVYRADCYGIEFARINLDGKTTTDSSSDTEIFIININSSLQLNRPAYTSLTGVITPDVFNVELSPKTCFYEHGNYLHIGMDKLDAQSIVFQTTTKAAYNLSRTIGGKTITEKADAVIGTLAKPLFLPQVFQFATRVPLNIVNLIEADSYGKIGFTWKGNHFYGYLLECSQQPALNAKQTFKLLAGADNDLSKLIQNA